MKKILVPVDFSLHSDPSVDLAVELAKAFSAKITVLNAYQAKDVVPLAPVEAIPQYHESARKALESSLDTVVKRIRAADLDAEGLFIQDSPVDAILRVIEEENVDHVVMGTRGNTGLKHWILGSVTERTARLAPCPVTAVPVPAEE